MVCAISRDATAVAKRRGKRPKLRGKAASTGAGMTHRQSRALHARADASLADAETGENLTQQRLAVDHAGDFVQFALRQPQFFGSQFTGAVDPQPLGCVMQVGADPAQRRDMAGAGAEGSLACLAAGCRRLGH